uniref:(California timema) hypothetical protein n=1 Tax=Timema californicum TaxID=61474 RepID=A0A7R9P856_TIMCA|nr:unnamed protein product [Timema californicum]
MVMSRRVTSPSQTFSSTVLLYAYIGGLTLLHRTVAQAYSLEEDTVTFSVNRDITYQDVYGFGGADTDATGVTKSSLSEDAGDTLIR